MATMLAMENGIGIGIVTGIGTGMMTIVTAIDAGDRDSMTIATGGITMMIAADIDGTCDAHFSFAA